MLESKGQNNKIEHLLSPCLYKVEFDASVDVDPSLTRAFAPSQPHEYTTVFQISMHKPKISLQKDLELVFPDVECSQVFICPCFQPSFYDLIAVSPQTNWERDLLGSYFISFGRHVCQEIVRLGYWADMTDPGDGFPIFSRRGAAFYPDVQGSVRCLKYATILVGCCNVLVHPVWGTKNYPSTLFTNAPPSLVSQVLSSINHISVE